MELQPSQGVPQTSQGLPQQSEGLSQQSEGVPQQSQVGPKPSQGAPPPMSGVCSTTPTVVTENGMFVHINIISHSFLPNYYWLIVALVVVLKCIVVYVHSYTYVIYPSVATSF